MARNLSRRLRRKSEHIKCGTIGITGICLDEMQSKPGKENYYKNLTEFSKSLGLNFTVGNPGTDVSPTYIGTVDYLKYTKVQEFLLLLPYRVGT